MAERRSLPMRAFASRRALAALLVTLVLGLAAPALRVGAVPRYAARYEQNCMLCHVNPSGGGMRSAYAVRELVPKEIAASPMAPAALADLDPKLGKNVSIGTDLRQMFFASTANSIFAPPQGFFPMQGDVYLAFQADPKFLLYYDRGFSNTYEAFGMAHFLPWDGYVKAGRFVPAYGWKFDDHTMYVRDALGFAPPANSDAGVELGFSPPQTELTLSLLNGNRGGTLDNDRRLALAGTLGARFRIGPVTGLAGVSGFSHPGLEEDLNTAGLYGYLSAYNLTWVGEGDWTRRDAYDPGTPTLSGAVMSHELTFLVRRGVELKATYDFFDPDRDIQSGSKSRWGAGATFMPRPFFVAEALYRKTDISRGPVLDGRDFDEGVFQLHFLY
jgi:hypothetical protein